ncbi:MAG TPA: PDZ domain-containing protein [Prolixibacteraceae bacterium]|nr:PDZ domain-containing protein [Prolixibacteraceae bacterium]
MKTVCTFLTALLLAVTASHANAADDVRLLRFPDINNNLIAFVYAGDIWTVNASGGEAKRLTSHEGMELFPKISPDGQWIAFSGEYSGSRQIFVMPSGGGIPQQLTWYNSVGVMPPRGGWDNVPIDWTPDSKQILFRANRTTFGERNGKYFLVGLNGGLEQPLQVTNGGFACFSPDASKLAFTPVDREFRNWKRYQGGRATDIWVYDLKNNTSEQITDFKGTDQLPVWFGDQIFFASDRDLKLNIWQYNTKTKETKQLTFHKEFDAMWPSGEGGQLVYENGGFLYKLNLQTGKQDKVTVSISFDNPNLLPYYKNVKEDVHSATVSPTGKRALFDARGDIFSVPAENGITENLTQTQDIREIYPSWSPDGKYMAYYSDATGEYEVYLLENAKGAVPKQLTKGSSAWKYAPVWSPDSKYLVYSDRTMKLWVLEVATGKQTEVDKATANEIRSYDFSPDSRWIAYPKEGSNGQAAIWVYDLSSGKRSQLTSGEFNDSDPVFSADGNYLFFTSGRDFNLAFSSFEFDYLYNRSTRMYAAVLKANGPKLFKDKNDVEPVKEEKKPEASEEGKSTNSKDMKDPRDSRDPKDNKDGAKPPEKNSKVEIDFEGINNRIVALPGEAGEYRMVGAVEGGLIYISGGKLMKYNITEEKAEEIMDRVMMAQLSGDRKMAFYRSGPDWGICKLAPGQKPGAGKLNLDQMEMKIDPRKEWNQIYADGWRIFRDFFYVDNLHGVNWPELKTRYSALLPSVSHRADLDYILNEIVAESNTGHSYVDWGDFPRVKRIDTGLLGAELTPDAKAGKFRITKIYSGENWNSTRRSPLTEQGVDIKEGDYLLSINGKVLSINENPYLLLENTLGKTVELTVSSSASGENPRTALVKPIASEQELRYFNWVNERRALVDKLSGGKIGYIHVPNTSTDGNRELFRGMYTYHDKEALIIDDRYNGGGFIPDVMADLLDRKTLVYWHRNGLTPETAPNIAHSGPKAMLINGYSSSGGDAFPYFFKKLGLGKLIGTRTWGGLVGISGNARLVDGGYISVPRFGIFDENEKWIIEGIGVYPDIEVVDRPEQLAKGEDPCIVKAVEELLKELKEKPVKKVNPPVPPDRSKWHE